MYRRSKTKRQKVSIGKGEVYRETSKIKVKYTCTERQEIQRGRARIWTIAHRTEKKEGKGEYRQRRGI